MPDNEEGKTPVEGGEKKGEEKLTAAELAGLKESITTLQGGVKEILEVARKRAEEQARRTAEEETTIDDEEQEPDEAVLETMPRSAFSKYLLKAFQRNLDAALKPVTEAVQKAQQTAVSVDVKTQVEKFADQHPDFPEWKDEMLALAKDNPTLSVARLYNLAKLENPDKAKEIDKKFKKDEKEGEQGKAAAGKKKPAANGLTPGGSAGEHKPGKMTPQQAANAAWEETVAQFGGNPWG